MMRKAKGGAQKVRERRDKQNQLHAEMEKTSKISSFFSTTKGAPHDSCGGNDVAVQLSLTVASPSEEDEHTTVELEPHIGAQQNEPAGADEMEVLEPGSEPNSEPNSEPDSDSESAPDPEPSMPIPPGAPGDDLGKWDREEINEQSRCFWIAKGASTCQHLNGPFDSSMMIDGKVKRWCTRSMFTRVHNLTRSQTLRDWLCYSPSKGSLLSPFSIRSQMSSTCCLSSFR